MDFPGRWISWVVVKFVTPVPSRYSPPGKRYSKVVLKRVMVKYLFLDCTDRRNYDGAQQ